jgi:hypothetical protein
MFISFVESGPLFGQHDVVDLLQAEAPDLQYLKKRYLESWIHISLKTVIAIHVNISCLKKASDMNIGNMATKTCLQIEKQIYVKDVRFSQHCGAIHILLLSQYLSYSLFDCSCLLLWNL